MPAKSKAQQRFFGMVRAAQKGEMDNPSSEVLDAADSISVKDAKKMAKTKHKGLPEIKEGKKKGLWDNIHAKRKRGEKPAKPGDKDYPKTLNVEGAAWTKKAGKNKEGGLNEKGRKSYERENPGSDLKAPQPEGGSRKKSFCARMGGMKKKLTSSKTANDPDSRINKALRKWKCNEEKIEEVAFLAGLAKGAAVAAKGAVKQKVKQVVKQKAANVAAGAIPQPNRDQQNESKGTAELAAIKLRGRKVCAECGSLAHVTGDCPKKEHSVKESNKYKGVLTDPMKEAYRVLASSDGQEKPSQFSYKDEKTAKKYADSIKKGGGKATVTKESVLTKLGRKKKVEEKNPKKAMDAGARAKRLLQRKVHAKYVSGSQDLVPDDIRDHVEIATEAKVDKGRSDYGKATIRNWRHSGPSTVEPAMFDSENKRGKTIDKRREEHKSRRGVKGAKVPTYKKEELSIVDKMLIEFAPTFLVIEKKKQPSVHDDYYDPMEDPTFDPHEAEATRGQSGKGTKGKMNVRKKYPVKEGVVDVVKKGAKRHKDAVEKKKIKNRKAVPYAALAAEHEPEGEVVNEKISASGYARAKKYREDQAREKDRKENEYFAAKAKTHKWDGEKWNKREVSEENKKGLDGKACWDGYKLAGTKKKGGKTVDNCVPVKEAKVDAGKSPEEKEKVRNVRKFGVSHNVAGHGKLRRSLHKMNRGDKKIPGDKSAWVEMEAYRVLASSDGQEKPSQFSYKDEKTAKKYADSIKKGGGKATVVKEDIGSFKDYMANVEAAKKRQENKQENRKKKSDAYIERVRKGIKFYDAKGSGRMVKGKKVYDRK